MEPPKYKPESLASGRFVQPKSTRQIYGILPAQYAFVKFGAAATAAKFPKMANARSGSREALQVCRNPKARRFIAGSQQRYNGGLAVWSVIYVLGSQ
jgi:hypothetical protein